MFINKISPQESTYLLYFSFLNVPYFIPLHSFTFCVSNTEVALGLPCSSPL